EDERADVFYPAGHAATGRAVRARVRGARPAGQGLATKQVARQLGISPKTCDHHIQSLYSKAGVSTRAGATLFALQHGLVSQDPGRGRGAFSWRANQPGRRFPASRRMGRSPHTQRAMTVPSVVASRT